MLTLYGAAHSGSVAVEAALTLIGLPFQLVEAQTWVEPTARERVAAANPRRQVPTLVLPDGTVMTESAAILIDLADRFPDAGLAPLPGDARRGQFLRWMIYVSTAIYSHYWIMTDPRRIGVDAAGEDALGDALYDRIDECWRMMDAQLSPAPYLLGDRLGVLDIYVAVISRFGPRRKRFAVAAPGMAAAIERVDADPRLAPLWRERL